MNLKSDSYNCGFCGTVHGFADRCPVADSPVKPKPKRGRTNKFMVRIVWGGDRGGSLTITSADGKTHPTPDRLTVASELEQFAKQIRECEPRFAKADAESGS